MIWDCGFWSLDCGFWNEQNTGAVIDLIDYAPIAEAIAQISFRLPGSNIPRNNAGSCYNI